MEVEESLNFHLEENFENDFEQYENFLQLISLKFEDILKDHIRVIERYISNRPTEVTEVSAQASEKVKEFTTSRQVLAMYFLLDELKPYDELNKAALTKFLIFLTSKESGASSVKNTSIYKNKGTIFEK
ncbi:MAG TPA: hypothetical protein VHZ50_07800 [Puia sp.]|jgi:uncharacterized protein YydD (DUF2326 family)|nr:hypothetical protein [Puia sp.]